MTTTLESTADQLVALGATIDRFETRLASLAGIIANMAADEETSTPGFDSIVAEYRTVRDELVAVKQSRADALGAAGV